MSNDMDEARKIVTERYGSNDVQLASLIAFALSAARAEGRREMREEALDAVGSIAIGNFGRRIVAETIRALPDHPDTGGKNG